MHWSSGIRSYLDEGQALDARARDEAPLPEGAEQRCAAACPQRRSLLALALAVA